ncbi:maleylpyruvate isomerase family mycothiol-dependent enzyme [Actinoplanes oblitus]|uniref:Maleylpyruvate isomerase family mycothiol-dependent enzyme n=1 Tax=Actinoplanes oblitus TaxID=3040509 RepID=A0ABY8WK36_9ACTN|nr:maleylpyruvate isomerase family mycothiol-dependent enzyme [Actinoplanes oblitus]WIM98246.1 maleylpyruvate isomerase family mycothiol-dependent enzyme [Actinoplanes oblitus]
MTSTSPFPELVALVEERSAALREAVAAAPDPAVRVPGCPGWTLRDLLAHVGEVQRFWATAVTEADPSGPPSRERPGGPVPDGELLDWSAESTRMLGAALRAAGPEAPCWAWWPATAAPHTAGAVARHQVQEAAVHAYDAGVSLGRPEPLPAAVAVDGVHEFLATGLGSLGPWPHRPARVQYQAIEGPSWTVDLSPSGATADPAASGEPVTRVQGTASDLVLLLYRRIPLDAVRIDGDREVAAQLRDWTPR